MVALEVLCRFLSAIEEDPRIGTAHIALYLRIWKLWMDCDCAEPLVIFGHALIGVCKISSYSTYHKTLKDLCLFGYLRYEPSFNRFAGSRIFLH